MELRTIPLRFRVWDDVEKCWGVIPSHHIGIGFDLLHGNANQEDSRYIISQDTGLKDKSNKSIFTGDLVKCWDENIGQVYYDKVLLQLRVKFDDGDDEDLASCEPEVVGNIWQNSELLESDK